MKAIIKVLNMESQNDVKAIQEVLAENEGIIASQISLKKNEVIVIYNNIFINRDNIINFIEDLGYIVT